jgi:primosomal protein N' (replication factor Y)
VTLTGSPAAIDSMQQVIELPDGVEVLGPVPVAGPSGPSGRPEAPGRSGSPEPSEPSRAAVVSGQSGLDGSRGSAASRGPRGAAASSVRAAPDRLFGPAQPPGQPRQPARDVDGEAPVRLLLRCTPEHASELARAVSAGASVRSARKEPGSVRVQVDPLDLI